MAETAAQKRGKRIGSGALLIIGVAMLWWGGNWKVALGGYCLAAWAFGKANDTWQDFGEALGRRP